MLQRKHFHILVPVIPNRLQILFRRLEFTLGRLAQTGLIVLLATFELQAAEIPDTSQRAEFSRAWQAAARGNRADFEQLMPGLRGYLLFPYLQYEDLRFRRASVKPEEMAGFLTAHEDWAFTPGLSTAWLRSLGEVSNWDALAEYGEASEDTEVRCYLARAKIQRGDTEGLLPEVQALWTVGKSQPDACDPAFNWLRKQGGITPGLAWERIRRAFEARQPGLVRYLARYLGKEDRAWAERWYQQDRSGYRRLADARKWPDLEKSREIAAYGIRRLARSDSDRAWQVYQSLDRRFKWSDEVNGAIVREIALWSAVEGADETPVRMQSVPAAYRDGSLLEWWVRFDISRGNWSNLVRTVASMPADLQTDERWRYWEARAKLETGDASYANPVFEELALRASYYGFLSADQMDLPYTICPQEPVVSTSSIDALKAQPGFERALELRRAGLATWARSEWKLAARALDRDGLRAAAALATSENWPDMAIVALGNSGDRRWYGWRFPLAYVDLVEMQARKHGLDPAWVLGLMRSESAMAEDALSSAGARGLMQVMPGTARQVARRHSLSYQGKQQLMQPVDNIRFGTTYLRELMDRFADNPVLVSGAYNAGPRAVERWMDSSQLDDPAAWIETLPYYETRDYIPRVLAFSTLYDWRLERPVSRISSRMPEFNSAAVGGTMRTDTKAEVVCRTPG